MRSALVAGWNGPSAFGKRLAYAEEDSKKMATTLASGPFNFNVTHLEASAGAPDFRAHFLRLAEEATAEDVILVSIASHGILDRGDLVILTNDFAEHKIMSTGLLGAEILRSLARCRARNKLLILDCCHAAGAVSEFGTRSVRDVEVREITGQPDSFLILAASDRLEVAYEDPALKAGLFTSQFIGALSNSRIHYSNNALNDVIEHIRYNLTHFKVMGRQYPMPIIIGSQRQPFPICDPNGLAYPRTELADGLTFIHLPYDHNNQYRTAALAHATWALRNPVMSSMCDWAISERPVTNAQYRMFVSETGHRAPVGEHWNGQEWIGKFRPWENLQFSHDEAPVVCVTFEDAQAFATWAGHRYGISLLVPPAEIWDFAAFGFSPMARDTSSTWLNAQQEHHTQAAAPAPCVRDPQRMTKSGTIDMIGNVWEWCTSDLPEDDGSYRGVSLHVEVRGGGWIDDLKHVRPFERAHHLSSNTATSHSDLGFRLAGWNMNTALRPSTPRRWPWQKR